MHVETRCEIRMLALCCSLLALIGAVAPDPAWAGGPKMTDADRQLLPAWCEYAFERYKYRSSRQMNIKDPFIAAKMHQFDKTGCSYLHHYCYGHVWMNRYLLGLKDGGRPQVQVTRALVEFRATREQCSPKCALVPIIFTNEGDLELRLNDTKAAEKSYLSALEADPHYAPAIIKLSDIYELKGKRNKAIGLLKQAVAAIPNSSALKKKLRRMEQRAGQGH